MTPTLTELKPLLEQWAALEPEWCQAPDEYRVHFGVRAGKWKDDHEFAVVVHTRQEFTSSQSWHEGAALLRSVLEAIAAKGWELCFEFDQTLFPAAPWSAAVSKQGNESSFVASAGLLRVFEASAPEPAIALLSAYLQALQTQAKAAP